MLGGPTNVILRLSPTLIPVIQRRFITMVSIRDNQFLVLHFATDFINHRRIRNGPDSVPYFVLVGEVNRWTPIRRKKGINLAVIFIQHEKLTEVCFSRPKQV
jgi:hypothetical protein